MSRLGLFWTSHLIIIAIALVGLWMGVSIWLRGKVNGRADLSAGAKIVALLKITLGTIFSAGFWPLLKAFILDGLLHRRLFKEDKLRWVAHASMFLVFLFLGILSTITGFFEEVLKHFLHIESPLVLFITDKDTPIMALMNEIGGLIIIFGGIIAAVRRFIVRPAHLRTTAPDTLLIVALLVIIITGYPIEAIRIISEDVPPSLARYSFVGYPMALLIEPLNWPWESIHFWLFFFHVGICSLFLLYLPFSKFFHVLVSPVIAVVNSVPKTVSFREGEHYA
jgi:nitrate reductase gamma subunit